MRPVAARRMGGVGGAWQLRLVEWVLRRVEGVDAGAYRSVRAVELDQEAVGLRPLIDGAEAIRRLDVTRRMLAGAVVVAERQILLHPSASARRQLKKTWVNSRGGTF